MRLTVEPLGVVFNSSLEGILPPLCGGVVKVSSKNNSVRLGELSHRAAVEASQTTRVTVLHPHGRVVVVRIERTAANA